jgi:hypothetical protein
MCSKSLTQRNRERTVPLSNICHEVTNFLRGGKITGMALLLNFNILWRNG